MKKGIVFSTVLLLLSPLVWRCASSGEKNVAKTARGAPDALSERAAQLAQKLMIVDTHIDVPYRLREKEEDISLRTQGGDFDYVRAKDGGLNAPFMSIYTPAELQETGGSKALADQLIDMVEGFQQKWPDKFALAASPADLLAHFEKGLISLPMGMENGAPIEGSIENLRHFYDRGIRYITLTHGKNNHICDSSYDTRRKWNGLSPFGKEVVVEMNRLGIMVDISHVSDDTFFQVMEISEAPPIASHSSCRSFTPGFERNMSDEMIKLLAEKGGVIMINFGSSFLKSELLEQGKAAREHIRRYLEENQLERDDPRAREYIDEYRRENVGYAHISDVVDHLTHVIEIAGIDFVGLGSDYDGVGDSLPTGLKDVSAYPNLIAELLKKGHSEEDIAKVCSGNILRVWREVEKVAAEIQAP